MPRYINENEIYALFNRRGQASLHVGDIDVLPRADVEPVVHGRWIVKGQDVFCSHCDKESGHNQWGASAFSDYCPNCGAKMDEKVEHVDG